MLTVTVTPVDEPIKNQSLFTEVRFMPEWARFIFAFQVRIILQYPYAGKQMTVCRHLAHILPRRSDHANVYFVVKKQKNMM